MSVFEIVVLMLLTGAALALLPGMPSVQLDPELTLTFQKVQEELDQPELGRAQMGMTAGPKDA